MSWDLDRLLERLANPLLNSHACLLLAQPFMRVQPTAGPPTGQA